ncbi:universal stress protein [Haloflavibacter putidus]|uniref:Universal stress protein n=1 Tax=Haloflavibacter putidus TaxID=2576776 RepID=A0A507ZSK5_9FLAO|nr:universal stress protein [Haloflavibacter putidus]TQD38698.1 universal stress protein [Haloflavibacter putidus]
MNVLITTDFSKNARNAVCYALSFFGNVDAQFHILHVENNLEQAPFLEDTSTAASITVENNTATNKLERLKELLIKKKLAVPSKISLHFEQKKFIDVIREKVETLSIDFIAMGTKGASALKQSTVGSHTTDVITRVKCPVFVIPEKATYQPPKSVVFPTDFNSIYQSKVLRTLSHILLLNKAELSVLYVSKKNEELSLQQKKHKRAIRAYLKYLPHNFHFTVNSTLEEALQVFLESHNISIIAMSAKNINLFQHLLFHPELEKISYPERLPFLVLHE